MDGDDMESSLSSHASSEFENDVRNEEANLSEETEEHADTLTGPPTKKQRLGAQFAYRSTAAAAPTEDLGEISSDTSGSVPGSPLPSGITPEDDMQEQVTVCHWKGCDVGDCANMDNLVTHVHDDHIGVRQKKYACEWVGCARFGAQHASGYALRAHMRSHTREKPFFCALPECDKSFTRSDALAKHMRTVHETEALRPSDPIPRNHSSAGAKPQRLKLFVKEPPNIEEEAEAADEAGDADVEDDDATIATNGTDSDGEPIISEPWGLPSDVHIPEDELALPRPELFNLSMAQVFWSEEAGKKLQQEVAELEGKYKEEWLQKELVLDNIMEFEVANADYKGNEDSAKLKELVDDLPKTVLPMKGRAPWWREGSHGSTAAEESGTREEHAERDEVEAEEMDPTLAEGGSYVED